jgi:flagellar hook-associated protein 3 FlgL
MTSISGISDLGMASRLVAESSSIKKQLDTTTEQSASGLVSSSYSGLGTGAIVSLSLNPQIDASNTWSSNIDGATARMSATQNVMTELTSIASQFSSDLLDITTASTTSIDTIAAQARDALQQVGTLLNTQVGNDYIFSGQDTANPAVPNPQSLASSSFFTQIQSAMSNLGANGAVTTTALIMSAAKASANSPFDPTIGTAPPTVEVGSGQRVQTGIVANTNLDAASTPSASSTGSYMLDLMTALASIGSLSSSQISLGQPFSDMLQNIGTTLSGAQQGLTADAAMLGSRQSQLTTRQTDLSDTVTALTKQVSNVQDVDMAASATKLAQLQTQLQASYKLISGLSQFSLVDFMS